MTDNSDNSQGPAGDGVGLPGINSPGPIPKREGKGKIRERLAVEGAAKLARQIIAERNGEAIEQEPVGKPNPAIVGKDIKLDENGVPTFSESTDWDFPLSGAARRETVSAAVVPLRKDAVEQTKRRFGGAQPGAGRPSKYKEEYGQQIFVSMYQGMTLSEAIAELKVDPVTVYNWKRSNEEFSQAIMYGKEALADYSFSQAIQIPRRLWQEACEQGTVDKGKVAAARLLTESLRWYAERLDPRNYGNKNNEIAITNNSVTIDARALDHSQRDTLRELLLTANKDSDKSNA